MIKTLLNNRLLVYFALGVCFCIYGLHLCDGYFADDFLYIAWLHEGFGKLLRVVTIDSFYPKMIRPIPAISWGLSLLPFGDILLHLLSILLHATNAFLIGWMIQNRTNSREAGYAFCALFAAFPLFGEPILWLSSNFDLWATFFSLLSLAVIFLRGEEDQKAQWMAAGFFVMGLLSKESIIILPILLPLLFPWEKIRRLFIIFCIVAAAYLCFRIVLFHGIGGYQDESGQVILLASSPVAIIRVLMLQIPYRILLPLKFAGAFKLPILLGSIIIICWTALCLGMVRKPIIIIKGLICFLIALLPVGSMIRIEYDHLGSRLIYLPIAVLLLSIGLQVVRIGPIARILLAGLALMWGSISIVNASSWTAAKKERNIAISVMKHEAPRLPKGSTVLMDVHDTLNGAYVFNNGIDEAAEYYGIANNIRWEKGTMAAFDVSAQTRLGKDWFEIGFTPEGNILDWTHCAATIGHATLQPIILWEMPGKRPDFIMAGSNGEITQLISPMTRLGLKPGYYCVQVVFKGHKNSPIIADLFWRTNPAFPFTGTDTRRFLISSDGVAHVILRLAEFTKAVDWIQFRVDLNKAIIRDSVESLSFGPLPRDCLEAIRE